MTPDDIRAYREQLGLTQAQLAAHLGRSRRTIEEWENPRGKGKPPPELPRALRDLERELAGERLLRAGGTHG